MCKCTPEIRTPICSNCPTHDIHPVNNPIPLVVRLRNERKELKENYGKLAIFICSDAFDDVSEDEKVYLQLQHSTMGQYLAILDARIKIHQ